MKPKAIIPTNGNPTAAVAALTPDTISTGTVPLLQHLQTIKEQATGMSKAAQGLNDTLYVSGNSEQKLAAVQSASQKRIQHIARRFAETGFKRLIEGVYCTIRKNIKSVSVCMGTINQVVDCENLPEAINFEVTLDIGENSNANMIQKLQTVGTQILPALEQAGAKSVVKVEAPAVLASKLLEAMSLDSSDYLVDYNSPEFKERAAEILKQQSEEAQKTKEFADQKTQADLGLAMANIDYTNAQSMNTKQDNAKQLAVAIDRHFQEWAKLTMDAQKDGVEMPPHPDYQQIMMLARQVINSQQ
jgi:hypothetical protein